MASTLPGLRTVATMRLSWPSQGMSRKRVSARLRAFVTRRSGLFQFVLAAQGRIWGSGLASPYTMCTRAKSAAVSRTVHLEVVRVGRRRRVLLLVVVVRLELAVSGVAVVAEAQDVAAVRGSSPDTQWVPTTVRSAGRSWSLSVVGCSRRYSK